MTATRETTQLIRLAGAQQPCDCLWDDCAPDGAPIPKEKRRPADDCEWCHGTGKELEARG